MPEIPFAVQWIIPESRLIPLKDSINSGRLCSIWDSNILGFDYYFSIFPNGRKDRHQGKTCIYLHLQLKDVKKVYVKWNLSIESANYFFSANFLFEHNAASGKYVCDSKEFFDPVKKFIVDGKCTVKFNGIFIFKIENSSILEIGQQQKWEGGELGDELWEKDETKDFTIIVDEKEIKAHKFIMDARSNVFSAMLNPKMKESIESKVVIPDFSFDVVQTAVKLIYNSHFYLIASSLTIDDQMSLLQFLDKYDLPKLKGKIENLLINQISASTTCQLANCSILTNSENLKKKCIEFMIASFKIQTPLFDIEILDKDIALKILRNSLYKNFETK